MQMKIQQRHALVLLVSAVLLLEKLVFEFSERETPYCSEPEIVS
jgi:hypothetical protein